MLDLDPTVMFISLIVCAVGSVYYAYGKKKSMYFRITGIILFLFPFFISELWWLIGIALVLVVLPFILERVFPI